MRQFVTVSAVFARSSLWSMDKAWLARPGHFGKRTVEAIRPHLESWMGRGGGELTSMRRKYLRTMDILASICVGKERTSAPEMRWSLDLGLCRGKWVHSLLHLPRNLSPTQSLPLRQMSRRVYARRSADTCRYSTGDEGLGLAILALQTLA